MPYYIIMTIIVLLLPFSIVKLRSYLTAPGGKVLLFAAISAFEWSLCALIESLPISTQSKIFFSMTEYFGLSLYPIFTLLFALYYSGILRKRDILKTRLKYLFIPAVLILFSVYSNPLHKLVWPGFTPGPDHTLIYHHGPLFWAYITYFFLLALTTVSTLFFVAITDKSRQREVTLLMGTLFMPWWSGILYITKWNPFTGYDIVSLSAGLAMLFTTFAIHFKIIKLKAPGIIMQKLPEETKDWIVVDSEGAIAFSRTDQKQSPQKWKKETMNQRMSFDIIPFEFAGESFTLFAQVPTIEQNKSPKSEHEQLISRLEQLFQHEKLYTNQVLDLETLALHLKTNRTYLSQAVNRCYGINLPALINRYRLEHFKEETRINGEIHSIEERAKSAGFSGKSTFYRAFKKEYKMSPLEWQQQEFDMCN